MNILKKNMNHLAYIFPKLQTVRDVVRQMPKNSRFRRLFEKWHGKQSQTLLKSAWQHLYRIYWSRWIKVTLKKSLPAICKIFRLFVTISTADKKYSLLNRHNLTKPIHMPLSKKQKTFLISFLKFSNLA